MGSRTDDSGSHPPLLEYQPWYALPEKGWLRTARWGLTSLAFFAAGLGVFIGSRLWQWGAPFTLVAFFACFAGAGLALLGTDFDDRQIPAVLGLVLNVTVVLSGCLAYLVGLAR